MTLDGREKEELIRMITQMVMRRLAGTGSEAGAGSGESDGFIKEAGPGGVLRIDAQSVKCEPFEGRTDVLLKDIVTLEESPRIGAGIMELKQADFPWTLTYDEFDYVIEGTLEIEIGGRVVTGRKGDILHIPKNSAIHFRSPGYTRFAYFVYPADWANQQA